MNARDVHRINLIKRSYEVGLPRPTKHVPTEDELMTKMGRQSMVRKLKENQQYAETVRQKEMNNWRNRRRLISTAKATQYRHGPWKPNMFVQEEFTKRSAETTYLKKRTLGQIKDEGKIQDMPFYGGVPHRFVD